MAVLSDADRQGEWAAVMRELSDVRETCTITKADLQAAINAADDWANTNSAAYNSALPIAARTGLTAQQKARVLMHVLRRRWEVS